MEITQGILKYCQIYGITFDNKYSDIKSIVTTEDYYSSYLSNNIGRVSITSTILSDSNIYYNTVEDSNLINCNIENGRFINSKLLGESGSTLTNYINDGFFSGCTISRYIINGGRFYNCIIYDDNIWNFGYWDGDGNLFKSTWNGGVWNNGEFNGIWYDGTFNGGTFVPPGVWYNGIANGGVFSAITWYDGLARNATFIDDCIFLDGIFNDGYFINSNFYGGNFNGGRIINSTICGTSGNTATVYNGIIDNCDIDGETNVRGGRFTNVRIFNGNVFNIDAENIGVYNGNFYGGDFITALFNGGNIYNGMFINITGATNNLTIYNGNFKNSVFFNNYVKNGNFSNCNASGLTWLDGIFTDGTMHNCIWHNGDLNDSYFYAGDCYSVEISNKIYVGVIISSTSTSTSSTSTTTSAPTSTSTTTSAPTSTSTTTAAPTSTSTTTVLGTSSTSTSSTSTSSTSTSTSTSTSSTTTTTLALPTVATSPISNITERTATGGGSVINEGDAPVTVKGICWDVYHNPTTSDSKDIDGSGIGSFPDPGDPGGSLTGLIPGETYYVRAYATSAAGTGYGNEEQFTSLCTTKPTITNLTKYTNDTVKIEFTNNNPDADDVMWFYADPDHISGCAGCPATYPCSKSFAVHGSAGLGGVAYVTVPTPILSGYYWFSMMTKCNSDAHYPWEWSGLGNEWRIDLENEVQGQECG